MMLRKKIVKDPGLTLAPRANEIDIPAVATVLLTSEAPDHPVEYVFDSSRGPGGTRWVADQSGDQTLVLAFDSPQTIRKVSVEIEEREIDRTQELQLSISSDGGRSYREILRQEYTFSPPGTTFEKEEWTLNADAVTHLRLSIRPDKGGRPSRATLTSLALQ